MRQKNLKLDKIDSIALRMILDRAIKDGLLDAKGGVVEFINLKCFAEKIMSDIDTTFGLGQNKKKEGAS